MNNDSISRSALKDEIVKLCERINANNGITVPTLAFTRIINNAPTIKPCENCDLYFKATTKEIDRWYKCPDCGAEMGEETSVCQNPKGNCFTCKLFEVCDAKTKPADMRGEE